MRMDNTAKLTIVYLLRLNENSADSVALSCRSLLFRVRTKEMTLGVSNETIENNGHHQEQEQQQRKEDGAE